MSLSSSKRGISYDRFIFWSNGIVLGLIVGIGVQVVFAWTAPTAAPPSNNTPPPITVSATTQTKSGQLNVTALGDANDGNYFLDPHDWSTINALKVWDLRPQIIYDRDEYGNYSGYYVNGDGWSRLNGLAVAGDTYITAAVDDADDIATKAYVDSKVSSASGLLVGGCWYDGGGDGDDWGSGSFNGWSCSCNQGTLQRIAGTIYGYSSGGYICVL